MLLNVLLATLVQTTVRSRAGPCVAHTACPGGLTDDRDEGVVDVSKVVSPIFLQTNVCMRGPPEWPPAVHPSGLA